MTRREFIPTTLALFATHTRERETHADIAIIGAGVGGCAAALAAARRGLRVILTEETDWIGGQLTSQAVPPDEHPWIEKFGCTHSYRLYREAVRDYYRTHYKMTAAARARIELNPGNGTVSRLTHEPRVSLAVLQAMLAPFVAKGNLRILLQHAPQSATIDHDKVTSVTMHDLRQNQNVTITAPYFLDATETGEVLPLTPNRICYGCRITRRNSRSPRPTHCRTCQ